MSYFAERFRVERRFDPVGHLPEHLRHSIIYGSPDKAKNAWDELRAWSRSTSIVLLVSEVEFLADSRAQVGFDAATSGVEINSGSLADGLLKALKRKKLKVLRD